MTIKDLAAQLSLTPLVEPPNPAKITGCYIGDLLSWVMSRGKEGQLWLTVMGNVNVIAVANLVDFSGIILCENAPLDDEAKAQAIANHVPVYQTPQTLYQLALAVSQLI